MMTGVHKTEAAAGKSELAANSGGGRPEQWRPGGVVQSVLIVVGCEHHAPDVPAQNQFICQIMTGESELYDFSFNNPALQINKY